jgi:hypothetical protein
MLPSNASEFESLKPPSPKRGLGVGGLVITLVLVLALAAIIGVAISRLSSDSASRPTAATSPTQAAVAAAAAGTAADATTAQAIQQVIRQVDDAQIQAMMTNDPQVMAATATPEFYQEQVINNQDLLDGGVTDIKLVNLEWGQINVNGNSATATVWETWTTTFNDGRTDQSRDRNIYTLVLDNGTWKVSSDEHPDQPAAGSPNPTPAPTR